MGGAGRAEGAEGSGVDCCGSVEGNDEAGGDAAPPFFPLFLATFFNRPRMGGVLV